MGRHKRAEHNPDTPETRIYQAIAEYLRANGWNVIVIGGKNRIRPRGPRELYKYSFEVDFTGAEIESSD